jgi:predicted nucleic acid-binding protein
VLLVDTGPLLAAADRNDPAHQSCRTLLEDEPEPLVTTALVIAEAAYLISRQLGPAAEPTLYSSIIDGELGIEDLTDVDWVRVRELVADYASLPLGGTDASLIAVAERLDITRIATLNARDFRVVRPRHTEAFTLLP